MAHPEVIRFLDSYTDNRGWLHDVTIDDIGENVTKCEAVGHVIGENDTLVLLALCIGDDGDSLHRMLIPKGCITYRRKIKL